MAEIETERKPRVNNNRPAHYNKPSRRQALLEIRRLIVDEGLSHGEIQLRLNLPSSTYFTYLDLLFAEEQEAIAGNHYTWQRLLAETIILQQRYFRRARKLTEIGDDKNIDAEQRIAAHELAGSYERACHDMAFFSPSYLVHNKLVPRPPMKIGQDKMNLSAVGEEEKDEYHD